MPPSSPTNPSSTPSSSTPPSSTPPAPLRQIVLTKSDLSDESLGLLNSILTDYNQTINYLLGHAGVIKLANHLDMNGNTIKNVADAVGPRDVVSQIFAKSQYSADVLRPHLEALGKSIFQTYRRLSDPNQREKSSSFLNQLSSTSPTANTSIVSAGVAGGGVVSVTVSGGVHERLDGSEVPYSSRTDTLSLPTSWGITSLIRSGGVVTATTSVTNTLIDGENFAVINPLDPSFAGVFAVTTIVTPGSVFKYLQTGPDATSGVGGDISLGGVYYYVIEYGLNTLNLVGGFASDTWSNRRHASLDGGTIVAVVVLNSSGLDSVNSAAGATAPQQGVAVPVVRRL